MRFNLYCPELEENVMEGVKWKKIKEFCFDVIKDRGNSPYVEENDMLSIELTKVVSGGIKKMSDKYTTEFLEEWGYKVVKIN